MKLIENWLETAWRAWSMRLAAVASLVVGWIVSDPQALLRVAEAVPEAWRPWASVAASLATYGLIAWARLAKQGAKP